MSIKRDIRNWTAQHYTQITQRYPDGVPESALAELVAEWATTTTTKTTKKTGGDAC